MEFVIDKQFLQIFHPLWCWSLKWNTAFNSFYIVNPFAIKFKICALQMWNRLTCNINVLNSNSSNIIQTISSFTKQLSIVKVDHLRSIFQSSKHSINSSRKWLCTVWCCTYANLLLNDDMLKINSYIKQDVIKQMSSKFKSPNNYPL